jgi:hypothetical protein
MPDAIFVRLGVEVVGVEVLGVQHRRERACHGRLA